MPIAEVKLIWKNGELIPWQEATTHVLAHGLQYGTSVFEGMRAYQTNTKGVCIFRNRDHVERLHFSARAYQLNITHTVEELMEAYRDTVRANDLSNCYLRPIVHLGYGELGPGAETGAPDVAIIAIPSNDHSYPTGLKSPINVGVSSWRRPASGTIPAGVKASGNYLSSRLIALEATQNRFEDGMVSEGQASKIFVCADGVLSTPPPSSGILKGITRDTVMKLASSLGCQVKEEPIARETLYAADKIFLIGTACEILPVKSVDRRPVGSRDYAISNQVSNAYFDNFSNTDADVHNWLDPCALD